MVITKKKKHLKKQVYVACFLYTSILTNYWKAAGHSIIAKSVLILAIHWSTSRYIHIENECLKRYIQEGGVIRGHLT